MQNKIQGRAHSNLFLDSGLVDIPVMDDDIDYNNTMRLKFIFA